MTIDLNLSSEQMQIVSSVGKVLTDNFPVSRLRGPHVASPDTGRLGMLAELGAFGLGSGEDIGGSGFSIAEEVLLFVEFGRHLVTPNSLAATIGARFAATLGNTSLAQELISGTTSICLANALRPVSLDGLAGAEIHLLDPESASFAFLWNDDGMVLLDCAHLVGERLASIDRSVVVRRCQVTDRAVAGHIAASAMSAGSGPSLIRQGHLLLSAMLLGIAEAARDMAVDYAKLRTQFGQPIGAFQAIKHRCADMAIGAQALGAQLVFATLAERDGWHDARFQNDACRMLAARCALGNARVNIQVHGGIGFTAECDAHLFLLRAHLYQHIGGTRDAAEKRLVTSE